MAITSNITTKPVPVITAGDGPGVLVNRDPVNQVFVGPDTGIFGGNINSVSVLDPLVGIPFPGDTDLYAVAPPGVASVMAVDYIVGAQNWSPSPQQVAAALQTGIFTVGISLQPTSALTSLFESLSSPFRVWGYGMSAAAYSTGALVAPAFLRFTLQNANMLADPLLFAETLLSLETSAQIANGGLDEMLATPIMFPETDSVQYGVNNGNSITGAFLRGSFWVKVSIP